MCKLVFCLCLLACGDSWQELTEALVKWALVYRGELAIIFSGQSKTNVLSYPTTRVKHKSIFGLASAYLVSRRQHLREH